MAFRTLVTLCLAATAGGIMTKGASEGSLPSQRRAAGHRAARDADSEMVDIVADAVEGLAEGVMDLFGGADEADEAETRGTSSDELESDDVDEDDEDDEEEGELSPAERQLMSALQGEYGHGLPGVIQIMDRGLAPDASKDDMERAKEYVVKTAEIMEAVDASGAAPAPEDAPGAEEEEEKAADKAADEAADEVIKKVAQGVGTIVDAVAPVAAELLDAVLGDDEDEE